MTWKRASTFQNNGKIGIILSKITAYIIQKENTNMAFIVICFIIAVICVIVLVLVKMFEKPRLEPRLYDRTNTQPAKLSSTQISYRQQGQSVIFGTCKDTGQPVIQTEEERTMNTLFVGPNGVGKTSHLVSTAIMQDIEHGDNAVIIFEGKNSKRLVGTIQALCSTYKRELKIFPDMGGYNPLGVGKDAAERASLFADMLSLAGQGGESNPYFLQQQQAFINAIVPLYEHAYHQRIIVEEMRKLCTSKEYREMLLEKGSPSREATNYKTDFGAYRVSDFGEKLSGLSAFISGFYIGGGIQGRAELYNTRNAESLSDAIDRKCVIIVREGGARGTSEHPLGILYLTELMRYARERTTRHLVSLYLDELHFFLSPSYAQFLATSREARIAQYLGFQSFGQLEKFGKEIALDIRTNCRTWIVHNGLKYEDCVIVSNEIGQRAHIVYSQSKGVNSTSEGSQGARLEDKYLYTPYQVQSIDENDVLYLSIEGRHVAPTRLVRKPPRLRDDDYTYNPPKFSSYPPLTVWEIEEMKATQQPPTPPKGAPSKQSKSGTKAGSAGGSLPNFDDL
jgi:hypothetical protein